MNYDDIISKRAAGIPPSGIRKFFDMAESFADSVSLGVGEPDFPTLDFIRAAAVDSLNEGRTHYTSNRGLTALRAKISEYLSSRFSAEYSPDEIIVTAGASEAIDIALRALLDDGDEVLVPSPSFVSYRPLITLSGGVAVPIECTPDNEFQLTPLALERAITPKTKAVILPYPNNPTGTALSEKSLSRICDVIKSNNLVALSDEIYAELTYGARHCSVAAIDGMRERTVLVSGFSKAFAMTGWRVGYVCAPEPLGRAMLKIHQYAVMCAPTVGQYAALAALDTGLRDGFAATESMRREYAFRREFMLSELEKAGLPCPEPQGAFYLFPSVEKLGMTGDEFAEKLMQRKHVAVVSGSAFGESGKNHVRISYAASRENLHKAMRRITEFVAECK